MKRLTLLAAVALLLASCAPLAQFGRDLLDTTDGASLSYVFRSETELPGLRFDPQGLALSVIIVAQGDELTLLQAPETAVCDLVGISLTCRMGDLDSPAVINLTGLGVVASATWRRPETNRVYQTFAR